MPSTVCHPTFPRCFRWALSVVLACAAALVDPPAPGPAFQPAPDPAPGAAALQETFLKSVRPFVQTYCVSCHGGAKPKGDLDLSAYSSLDAVARDPQRWGLVLDRLRAGDMPPKSAKQHPGAELRREIVAWVEAVRKDQADRSAGDPGPVPPRRLSNAEYDHTIRDLTGVDIRPARQFPVDPANAAGFDNSADALALSPALLNKYLEAARHVADHLVLATDALAFAPYPVVADTDRDKYCVRKVLDFYQRQRTDYADYFRAAWRYRHCDALGQPGATLAAVAAHDGVSPKYLGTVWDVLTGPPEEFGPVAALRALWQELPAPRADPAAVRAGCERMRDFVVRLRGQLVPQVKNLTAPKMNDGSQPLVMWKNREMAANRTRYAGGALKLPLDKVAPPPAAAKALTVPADPADQKRYEATFARFCAAFPDTFYVTERARVYLDPASEKKLAGRLLSAGFHSMTGYFRDDRPLYDLVLDADGQRELDRLWLDFDVITDAPVRQYTSFIWFERAETGFLRGVKAFDAIRAEDKDCTSGPKVEQFKDILLGRARAVGASEVVPRAIEDHFKDIEAAIRRMEEARKAAEPKHLAALQTLAERAYRRPLSAAERGGLGAFYRRLRDEDKLSHDEAVRDVLVSVLMSPHFLFRLEPAAPGPGVQPLTGYALASRLSYFLWASMPDAELLKHAVASDLHRPEVLRAQARRMLQDDRVRGLATEFAGNWLDIRRFEEHNAVDRGRFPAFTDELRRAMFEEPMRFFTDVARSDLPVLDFLDGRHTFVNPVLARHYGVPEPKGGPDAWVKVDDARPYGRGGLLPMAAFLTKNAPGLRTSPVKRGYWVVRRLLGEKIPPPPAEVPELPGDEAKLGDRTLREVLALHRADKACAGCHDRFDAIGLAFEGYGPVGERRTVDLGGRPVDARAAFPGGGEGDGVDGLRAYLRERRRDEFLNHLCRQLLAYALGRTLLPSDDALLADLRLKLADRDYRFSALVDAIITSPQFLNKRGSPAKGEPR
jgi:hypothetical protein